MNPVILVTPAQPTIPALDGFHPKSLDHTGSKLKLKLIYWARPGSRTQPNAIDKTDDSRSFFDDSITTIILYPIRKVYLLQASSSFYVMLICGPELIYLNIAIASEQSKCNRRVGLPYRCWDFRPQLFGPVRLPILCDHVQHLWSERSRAVLPFCFSFASFFVCLRLSLLPWSSWIVVCTSFLSLVWTLDVTLTHLTWVSFRSSFDCSLSVR